MSYDLGTKPNREAGPIERVVLQERLDEDDDGDIEGGPAEGGEGEEGRGEEVGLLDRAEQGWEEGVDRPSDEGSGGGGGGFPTTGTRTAGSDDSSNGGGLRVDRNSAAGAMAEAEARTDAARSSQFGAMEGSGGRGEPGGAMATGGREKLEEAVEGGGVEVVSGLEYDGNGKKTLQQYEEEYWGKGKQAGEGDGGGGSAGGAGWGSTVRPSLAPRLSVDLINVDPVKELVKMVSSVTRCLGSPAFVRHGQQACLMVGQAYAVVDRVACVLLLVCCFRRMVVCLMVCLPVPSTPGVPYNPCRI